MKIKKEIKSIFACICLAFLAAVGLAASMKPMTAETVYTRVKTNGEEYRGGNKTEDDKKPTNNKEQEKKNTQKKNDAGALQTGVDTAVMLWMLVVVISAIYIIGRFIYKTRKK